MPVGPACSGRRTCGLPKRAMRSSQQIVRYRLLASFAVVVLSSHSALALAAEKTGEQIFSSQCARCHGAHGEGTEDNYPDPLEGDKSVAQLTKLIHETMPDDAETKTPADDSAKVAQYIYDSFYSPEARVRNKPARVELSRLTVRQYQNALADLVGNFRGLADWGKERGLRGHYNQSRNIHVDKKAFERVDLQIDFDFGEGSPDPKQLEPQEFSVVWKGSLLAPDTGEYEF